MSEYISNEGPVGEPTEPQNGTDLNELFRSLDYQALRRTYLHVYNQFDQEGRLGDDPNKLQMSEIETAYPGLYELIAEMARNEANDDFSNGIVIGAITLLSIIKATVEVEELNRFLEV